jgi:WD40 repeat protein
MEWALRFAVLAAILTVLAMGSWFARMGLVRGPYELAMDTWMRGATSLAFDPSGSTLAAGGRDGRVVLWDLAGGADRHEFSGAYADSVIGLRFSPDGARILAAFRDTTILIWDLRSKQISSRWKVSDELDAEFAAVGVELERVIFGRNEELLFVDVARQTTLGTQRAPSDEFGEGYFSAAIGADGWRLAVGRWEGADLWNLASRRSAGSLRFEAAPSTGAVLDAVAFSPDGTLLAGAGSGQPVKIWNLGTGTIIGTQGNHDDNVDAVAFSPDGRLLAVAGGRENIDYRICVVDLATGTRRTVLGAAPEWQRALARAGESVERVTRPWFEDEACTSHSAFADVADLLVGSDRFEEPRPFFGVTRVTPPA